MKTWFCDGFSARQFYQQRCSLRSREQTDERRPLARSLMQVGVGIIAFEYQSLNTIRPDRNTFRTDVSVLSWCCQLTVPPELMVLLRDTMMTPETAACNDASAQRAEIQFSIEATPFPHLPEGRLGAVGGTESTVEAGGAGVASAVIADCPYAPCKELSTAVSVQALAAWPAHEPPRPPRKAS